MRCLFDVAGELKEAAVLFQEELEGCCKLCGLRGYQTLQSAHNLVKILTMPGQASTHPRLQFFRFLFTYIFPTTVTYPLLAWACMSVIES